jgi:hypothetical protein
MDHEAMVRYLVGQLRLPAADVERVLTAFDEYLSSRSDPDEPELDLGQTIRWIVEQTMLSAPRVSAILTELLSLSARLDAGLGGAEFR